MKTILSVEKINKFLWRESCIENISLMLIKGTY